MPVHAEFAEEIITLRMLGLYEPADIRAALLDALDLAEPARVSGLLFDVTASESLRERPTDQVRAMGRFLAANSHRFGGRLALVASADFAYGLMRLGSVVVEQEGIATTVFREESEARAWLRG